MSASDVPFGLVGRDSEFAALKRSLDEARSGLILVVGGPKVGKAKILGALRQYAEASGRPVFPGRVGDDDLGLLPMDAGTMARDLPRLEPTSSPTRVELGAPSMTEQPPVASRGRADWDPHSDTDSDVPNNPPPVEQVPIDPPPQGVAPSPPPRHAPRRALGATAPALLFVHHYQPTQRLDDWFRQTYLPVLSTPGAELLVVIGAYERDVAHLIPLARDTVALGPLDGDAVRLHLQDLGRALPQPLTEDEVRAYTDAASEAPALLVSFEELLALDASIGEAS